MKNAYILDSIKTGGAYQKFDDVNHIVAVAKLQLQKAGKSVRPNAERALRLLQRGGIGYIIDSEKSLDAITESYAKDKDVSKVLKAIRADSKKASEEKKPEDK